MFVVFSLLLILISWNVGNVAAMNVGGDMLAEIAAAAAKEKADTFANTRTNDDVETEVGCGCK